MRVFIVHAHPEPTSFNAALTRTAQEALLAAGHEVAISDLYADGFDPVSDRRNFVTVHDPQRYKQQVEEEYASRHDGYVPALQAEMDRLAWCDVLIFQFPLWWLGLPAILKGWVDRVFAVGRAYGGGRYYSRGVYLGKRAMCSVTIGGSADAYSDIGAYGPVGSILHPIEHGMLAFTGFSVIEPFLVFGPSRMTQEERGTVLAQYRERVLQLDRLPLRPMLDIQRYEGMVLRKPEQEN